MHFFLQSSKLRYIRSISFSETDNWSSVFSIPQKLVPVTFTQEDSQHKSAPAAENAAEHHSADGELETAVKEIFRIGHQYQKGRRSQGEPQEKGVYIRNGRKMIVK